MGCFCQKLQQLQDLGYIIALPTWSTATVPRLLANIQFLIRLPRHKVAVVWWARL